MWTYLQISAGTLCAVLIVIVAYVMRMPVSNEETQGYIVRPRLAMFSFAKDAAMFADSYGYDGLHVYYKLAGYCGLILSYFQSPPPNFNVTFEDTTFDGVKVRIYTPINDNPTGSEATNEASRAIVFYHGGGWVMGSVGLYSKLVSKISQDLPAVIISVEYRLAPKHIFPAAFDDCFKATKYFLDHYEKYDVDRNRIGLMGDSAGGNLAAAVAQRLNDDKIQPMPKLTVLIHPVLQATDMLTPSMTCNTNSPLLNARFMLFFYGHYLFGHQKYRDIMINNNHTHPHVKQHMPTKYMRKDHLPEDDLQKSFRFYPGVSYGDTEFWDYYKPLFMNPYFAPLMVRSSAIPGLPHTFIVSCQPDAVRDDSFHYAARLRKAGVRVVHRNLHNCHHGWMNEYETRTLDVNKKNYEMVIKYIDQNL